MSSSVFADSVALLARCDGVMDELEANCCAPRRSPRMAELRDALAATTSLLGAYEAQTVSAEDVVDSIETAGSQIGGLQVSCCAPSRMPLYDSLLHDLMQVQRTVKRHAKLAH